MTTREIGAYHCGRRLAAYWLDLPGGPPPNEVWVFDHFAMEDAEIYRAMSAHKFFTWFYRGYYSLLAERGTR